MMHLEHKKNGNFIFMTIILKSSLCDYSDAYKLMEGTRMISGAGADAALRNSYKRNKQVTFKNCAPLTDCINKKNNNRVYHAKYLDVVMLVYNLIKHSNNYRKTFKTSNLRQ